MTDQNFEVEPIAPDDAAVILEAKLQELEADGWIILVQNDYMARLTRGNRNIDLQVDLLGELQMEEKPLSDVQEVGRIVAIMLFIVAFIVILTLLSALGVLD